MFSRATCTRLGRGSDWKHRPRNAAAHRHVRLRAQVISYNASRRHVISVENWLAQQSAAQSLVYRGALALTARKKAISFLFLFV
jgi:hypothetical protein